MRPRRKPFVSNSNFIVVGILTLALLGVSQCISKPVPDDKGTEFMFTTPLCKEGIPPSLFMIPQTTQTVNVTLATIDSTLNVRSTDGAIRMAVPCRNITWNHQANGAFYLHASTEVSVFVEYADDSHVVFPLDTLASTYVVSTIQDGGDTFLAITANGSYVEIKLPDNMQNSAYLNGVEYVPGSTVNFTLSEYEYVAIKCTCDLTGAIVTSSLPVHVLVGGVSQSFATIEQLHSRNTWGKKFLFSNHPWISPEIQLQIIGQSINSKVSLIQKDTTTSSQFTNTNILSFNVTVTDFLAIESDSPVLCAILYDISDTNNVRHRTFSFQIPLLLYHVSSTYSQDSSVSVNSEVSAGLIVTVHSHPHIQFNDTQNGDPFLKPMTYFWKLFICENVPLTPPYTLSTSDINRVPFLAYILRRNNETAFRYILGMRITSIYDACTKSPRSHGGNGDGVDNDCDNRIDEEILNNKDDDGDSHVDEDVSFHGKIAPNPADLAYIFYRDNKEVETGISTSVVSVIVSIVVALFAVGVFIGIMLLMDKIRHRIGSSRVMPLNDS